MDASTSRALPPGNIERAPSMHMSALVTSSERGEQSSHAPGTLVGKPTPPLWSYGGQSAYPTAPQQNIQETRTVFGKSHSASGLAAPYSQNLPLEQSSFGHGRSTTSPPDQWLAPAIAPLLEGASAAAPSPSSSSLSSRHRSSSSYSSYSSGMVAPQVQGQGHQQQSFFQNQIRMSQQHPNESQALLVHQHHNQYQQQQQHQNHYQQQQQHHNHYQQQQQHHHQQHHQQAQYQEQQPAASLDAPGNIPDLAGQQYSGSGS
ncbi:unnamed protein product [Tilletia controversa]|nr:unnamed protein product [Tilletia controversa]CAD6947016.1 unnamed protein product [Tilletia controversa]CAD6967429.1 unnamed protein product [Tilletia controversa]